LRSELGGRFTEDHCRVLHAMMRIRINQGIADCHSLVYSPTPARAGMLNRADTLYRYRLEREIQDAVGTTAADMSLSLVQELRKRESIPFPLFALYFLKRTRAQTPVELLADAAEHRTDVVVAGFRTWLGAREAALRFGGAKQVRRTDEELKEIVRAVMQRGYPDARMGRLTPLVVEFPIDELTGQFKPSLDMGRVAFHLAGLVGRWLRRPPIAIPLVVDDVLSPRSWTLLRSLRSLCVTRMSG
jgi:hypothetical protein